MSPREFTNAVDDTVIQAFPGLKHAPQVGVVVARLMNRGTSACIIALVALCAPVDLCPCGAWSPTEEKWGSQQARIDSSADILSAIPGDVAAAVIVRNLDDLDAKLGKLSEHLGFPFSPYMLAKGWLEIVAGIEDRGPAAIALMPAGAGESAVPGIAMLIPTANRAELLSFLNPRRSEEEDGFVRVTLRGRESYVAELDGFTVFASDVRTLGKVTRADNTLAARFCEYQRKRAAVNDVMLWLDASSPAADGMVRMAPAWLRPLIGAAGGTPGGLRGVQLSARVDRDGVVLELYVERNAAQPGRPAAETVNTMLHGIPDEPFALAVGVTGEVVSANARKIVDSLLSALSAGGVIAPAESGELGSAFASALRGVDGVAACVSVSRPGSDGRIAVTKVVQTTDDARGSMDRIRSLVYALRRGPFIDRSVDSALQKLEYNRGVETSAGVTIDHITLDLSDFDALDRAAINTLLGHEGLLLRVGAVDDCHIAVALGGGIDRFNRIVATVRARRSPLASDPAVMQSSGRVARKRSVEAYLSASRAAEALNAVSLAAGAPVNVPDITDDKATVALALHSVGSSAMQLDVFIPTGFIVAVKDAIVDRAGGNVEWLP